MYEVVLTHEAEKQILDIAVWWSENRDPGQAQRWLAGFEIAINNLAYTADRYPLAREAERFEYPLYNLLYGLGRRSTHRAVYRIRDNRVEVLAVRHLAQQDLVPKNVK